MNKKFRTLVAYCHTKKESRVIHSDMVNITKTVADSFDCISYYHSHTTERKGGYFSPHLHIIIAVDEDKELDWHNSVRDRFKQASSSLWTLSNECDPRSPVQTLFKTINYCCGTGRKHPGLYIYSTNQWFKLERQETGTNPRNYSFQGRRFWRR